jgi:MFS family permease
MTRRLALQNERVSTWLAFALIPISGLAVDIYVPSIPAMAAGLAITPAAVKLTITVFLISYGLSQLVVGQVLDSYGRYRINLVSLLVFTASCISIVVTRNLPLILLLRFVQGSAVGTIVVAKRAFFIDVYSGARRRHYTSLVTVVWAAAPVFGPFVGGYLQNSLGWKSNFYVLALYGLVMLLLELRFSGETLKTAQPFYPQAIVQAYRTILSAKDFSLGLLTLGLSYAMIMVFVMNMPFIVEHGFGLSPVVTGYCALCSGIALFAGGLLGKYLIERPLLKRLRLANAVQLLVALAMFGVGCRVNNLYVIVAFVFVLNLLQGFIYNCYFTYCITRFPAYAASASGITSGGAYAFISLFSYAITAALNIHDQKTLSLSYIILAALIFATLFWVKKALPAAVEIS